MPSRASRWAHPHSRGENRASSIPPSRCLGSSPLTRGKRRAGTRDWPTNGLIPTHAGKTTPRRATTSAARAHPHSRGENGHGHGLGGNARGSSPLTRGKPRVRYLILLRIGLIPTHAGKTKQSSCLRCSVRAHPHSRGENRRGQPPVSLSSGSSPLTRGKRRRWLRPWCRGGLIPTHAGKTPRWWTCSPSTGAHPHSRGENCAPGEGAHVPQGSSPLTRGKRRHVRRFLSAMGLIPTHAGKTYVGEDVIFAPRAHPHSRGENQ